MLIKVYDRKSRLICRNAAGQTFCKILTYLSNITAELLH